MRIILKPAGLAVILIGMFVALVTPFLKLPRASGADAHPTPPVPIRSTSSGKIAGPKTTFSLGDGWKFYTEKSAICKFEKRDAPDVPSHRAYHFDIQRIGQDQWSVGFNNGVSGGAIQDKEKVRFRLWGRSPQRSKICLLLQKNAAPFPHCWKQYVTLEPQWKQYEFTFASDAYAPGEALAAIFLGLDAGVVDLADIHLERAE